MTNDATTSRSEIGLKIKLKNHGVKTHGDTRGSPHTRLYRIWRGIKTRCFNKNDPSYKHYGARGITMLEPWITSYASFKEWALANGYLSNLEIDRINNNGHYESDNCRWVTKTENSKNRRVSLVWPSGLSTAEVSVKTGISKATLYKRLFYGFTMKEAMDTPFVRNGSARKNFSLSELRK